MQPTDTHPVAPPTRGHGAPGGAVRMSTVYYDERGVRRVAGKQVPVNEFGQLTAAEYRCPQCKATEWVPMQVAGRGVPVCEHCNRRMARQSMTRPPVLPWGQIWRAVDRDLRAVWVGAGAAGLGELAVGHVPAPALVVAAPVVGVAAYRAARTRMLKRAAKRNRVELDDPARDKRIRAAIAHRARLVGYCAAVGCGWTALAAGVGLDPGTVDGRVSWLALLGAWLPSAATWWRHVRNERNRPEPESKPAPVVEDVPDGPPPLDADEAETRRIWATIVAAHKGKVIGRTADGNEILAPRNGKLAGTHLEDWHKVSGGWGATAVGPDGAYVGENFIGARGAVASAFRMKTSMITVIPDADDENRALVLAQRSSPIADVVRWAGPNSIDPNTGVAQVAVYCDGTTAPYEVYRPGWGCPHDFLCGTTGAGKSEALSTLFLIDRWAHYVDEDGRRHGLVADLLIDPQEGQSYGPFLDDLAAPVATTIEAAMVVVQAFRDEMRRRNRYLAHVKWTDEKGRQRKGRKWWNPLIDGPLLTLNIDEAHEFLAFKAFAAIVTSGARMYRKCGMRIRIATHTPLLSDLGGSMALRSMLTGGFVWVGRTADSLSGPVAFNGRLPVDPRTIPDAPGSCYILSRLAPKAMLARTMWEPDYYDWVRDDEDQPIGYPAELPQETLSAFGGEFARWAESARAGDDLWIPGQAKPAEVEAVPAKSVDAVFQALTRADGPMDMDGLDEALRGTGVNYSVRTIRDALKKLRDQGMVFSTGGRHELTPQAWSEVREEIADTLADALNDDGGESA